MWLLHLTSITVLPIPLLLKHPPWHLNYPAGRLFPVLPTPLAPLLRSEIPQGWAIWDSSFQSRWLPWSCQVLNPERLAPSWKSGWDPVMFLFSANDFDYSRTTLGCRCECQSVSVPWEHALLDSGCPIGTLVPCKQHRYHPWSPLGCYAISRASVGSSDEWLIQHVLGRLCELPSCVLLPDKRVLSFW